MELICTHAHTQTPTRACANVATFSVTPKCSHVHTTLSLSAAQAHERAQIICREGMETRPLPSPPSLT